MIRIRSCSKNREAGKSLALLLVLSSALCLMTSASSHGQTNTEAEAAAEALLVEMQLETTLANSLDQMLALQIQLNPAMAESAEAMKEILADYLSFDTLKPFYIDLYVDTFTAAELRELVVFYKTPVGKKSIIEMPELFAKSAQFGMQIMQDNALEIGQRMAEAQKASASAQEIEI